MPFDPNWPIGPVLITDTKMREQLTSLKDLNDALTTRVADVEAQNASLAQQLAVRPTLQQVLDLIAANAARNVDAVAALPPPWSENPPDRAEFNETRDKVNEVLGGLKHPA